MNSVHIKEWGWYHVYLDVNGDIGPIIIPPDVRINSQAEAIMYALKLARRYWFDERIAFRSITTK